jgi:hypothetical protein
MSLLNESIYDFFIPTPKEIDDWEGSWLYSKNQFRDGHTRYEFINDEGKNIHKLVFLRGVTNYYKEKDFTYEGTTLVVDAEDYPLKPKPNDLRCEFPGCNGQEVIHRTIITNHKFKEPFYTKGRSITLPDSINVIAHGQSIPIKQHDGCRCIPKLDMRIKNLTAADSVYVQGRGLEWNPLKIFGFGSRKYPDSLKPWPLTVEPKVIYKENDILY